MGQRLLIRGGFAAIALVLAGGGAVWAQQDEDAPVRPPAESFLSEAELLAAFSGRSLHGCYPDGEPWGERTAEDGALYDLLRGDVAVGGWRVAGAEICYDYSGAHGHQAGTACWNVVRDRGELFFFTVDEGLLGGTTYCVDLISRRPDGPAEARRSL